MKTKTTAGVLALFLGGLGGHKFYLGKGGQGVLYLVFCWTFIPCFIALIEAIMLFTMSDEEFDAKYNRYTHQGSFQRTSKFDELKKLGQLKEEGVLSDEEFEVEKNKILGKKLLKEETK
jgi:TM2 domain-containing membrane protein YozV